MDADADETVRFVRFVSLGASEISNDCYSPSDWSLIRTQPMLSFRGHLLLWLVIQDCAVSVGHSLPRGCRALRNVMAGGGLPFEHNGPSGMRPRGNGQARDHKTKRTRPLCP